MVQKLRKIYCFVASAPINQKSCMMDWPSLRVLRKVHDMTCPSLKVDVNVYTLTPYYDHNTATEYRINVIFYVIQRDGEFLASKSKSSAG